MARRALLVFADEIHVDLARRALPRAAGPLLEYPALGAEISGAVDIHLFTSGRSENMATASVHRQVGKTFRARFEYAIETVARLGYDEVVAIGRDCPSLRASDIEHAFEQLEERKLVLGPDHRGGCYLIAFRSADRALLRGVRWKRNTDCAQLRRRCHAADVFLLAVKHDLDSWNDLRIFARGENAPARLAAFILDVICVVGTGIVEFFNLASQQMRVRQQMPPPALAA